VPASNASEGIGFYNDLGGDVRLVGVTSHDNGTEATSPGACPGAVLRNVNAALTTAHGNLGSAPLGAAPDMGPTSCADRPRPRRRSGLQDVAPGRHRLDRSSGLLLPRRTTGTTERVRRGLAGRKAA
jgi:hypothetical protein